MIESGPPPAETPQVSNQPAMKETEPATKAAPKKAK
jgi:hypothetical protein